MFVERIEGNFGLHLPLSFYEHGAFRVFCPFIVQVLVRLRRRGEIVWSPTETEVAEWREGSPLLGFREREVRFR